MSGCSFKMNIGDIANICSRAADEIKKTDELLDAIGDALISSTQERFETSTAPDGSKWKEGAKKSGKTLVDKGILKNSITFNRDNNLAEIAIGSNVRYAAIHQFGGDIKPKNKKALKFPVGDGYATVKRVTIPARPYVGLSDDDREEIKEMLRLHLEEHFK